MQTVDGKRFDFEYLCDYSSDKLQIIIKRFVLSLMVQYLTELQLSKDLYTHY